MRAFEHVSEKITNTCIAKDVARKKHLLLERYVNFCESLIPFQNVHFYAALKGSTIIFYASAVLLKLVL